MNPINNLPPIKAKHYIKKTVSSSNQSKLYIEESNAEDLLDFNKVNKAFATFSGFFEAIPKESSLLHEIYKEYSKEFLQTSQYLWGSSSTPSLVKTIQEIQEYIDNNDIPNKNTLQQANQSLVEELENRDTIQNKVLYGSLLQTVE